MWDTPDFGRNANWDTIQESGELQEIWEAIQVIRGTSMGAVTEEIR